MVYKAVSHAAAAFFICFENAFVHKALDFAEGGVVACVENGGDFFGGEGLGEAASYDFVDELLFAFAKSGASMGVAELDAADFGGEELFAFLDGLVHHLQEP